MRNLMLAAVLAAMPVAAAEPPAFDAELAAQVGADEYGMRRYVMAFLTAGPNRDHPPEVAAELQRGHLANMGRLADEGKLVVAGPFLDGGELRGIFIFAVETLDEARALVDTDPAVQAGRLGIELRPWYGSAALMEAARLHAAVARQNP